mmetsp:Transcript_18844/g.31539  ORF Transcript_18844/g.31539 Transcript_18844/m.31539 type:complete len:177 (+) Transcript_18844:244-774(+)|eukprot:CAMPEP_0174961162 /NCGR_PEP_ID=MMETSP0004_2-20121128/4091_1 /TAXON_ID=420556 /ORGANISM="Ochromonas sp., Strain CCMP1393" /LENGTH=176 /DNA_ID=CAMNT_0016209585 /DNA_START=456 /DNA_END=986 /DNA_ORIENTATION=+
MSAKDIEDERTSAYADAKAENSVSVDAKDSNANTGAADAKNEATVTMTNDEILGKVQEFFYCNDALAEFFENYIKSESHVVDLKSDEYKLEYTQVFENYKSLFEEKLEGFITRDLNISINDFYFALKEKTDAGEDSSEAVFAQILIAVTDFDVFMTMMREAAQSLANEAPTNSDHK